MRELFANIGWLFGVGGGLGAVVFGLLSARSSVTIKSLENTCGAFESEIKSKQLTIDTKNATIHEKDLLIHELQQKSEVLQNIVTQAPDISKLAIQIGKQHKESQRSMQSMIQELSKITVAITGENVKLRASK